jgi:RNA polymerase sigma-70 factor (ECF subfamily)
LLHQLEDGDLVDLVRRGNRQAFEVLYRRHAVSVMSIAFRVTQSSSLAEDVTQATFLQLWRRAATVRVENLRLRAWLIAVARNAAVDSLRSGRRTGRAEVDAVADRNRSEGIEDHLIELERLRWLHTSLSHLPADQRQVLELAYWGGLTHGEIAAMLSLPVGTVKSRLRLAMQKLRAAWEEFEVKTRDS